MRVVDICAGIGGNSLAADWAGFTLVGQVEIDPWCTRVLEAHWPHVARHDDLRTFVGTEFGPYDLLCGGPPCQPVSIAGNRKGRDDTRDLWLDATRIIRDTRPRWVVLENVRGFVTLGLDQLCDDLEAEGYTVWPILLPATSVGAPHVRERIFITAHRPRADADDAGCQEPRGTRAVRSPLPEPQRMGAPAPRGRGNGRYGDGEGGGADGDAERRLRAVLDGVPPETLRFGRGVRRTRPKGEEVARWQKLHAAGNAVIPQIVYCIFETIKAYETVPAQARERMNRW